MRKLFLIIFIFFTKTFYFCQDTLTGFCRTDSTLNVADENLEKLRNELKTKNLQLIESYFIAIQSMDTKKAQTLLKEDTLLNKTSDRVLIYWYVLSQLDKKDLLDKKYFIFKQDFPFDTKIIYVSDEKYLEMEKKIAQKMILKVELIQDMKPAMIKAYRLIEEL